MNATQETRTRAQLRTLTDEQRAEVVRLAAYAVKTILTDDHGQAWQVLRGKGMRRGAYVEFRVMKTIGSTAVYELDPEAGARNEHELADLLECGPFVEVPLPSAATTTTARRIASTRRFVSTRFPDRVAILDYVTVDLVRYCLLIGGRPAQERPMTPSQFDAEFAAAADAEADEQRVSLLITEDEQPESRYHIETDSGEYFASNRRAAVRFARSFETAQVWEWMDDENDQCIYDAEA